MRDKRMDGRGTTPEELLLIRAGHHLWRSRGRSEWAESALSAALQTIWDAKKALRVELHRSWLEYVENRNSKLAGTRGSFKSKT